MTITLQLDPETEARLRERAEARGADVAEVAAEIIRNSLDGAARLAQISGPLDQEFAASGMTDEELSAFLEEEKHAMRAERRAGGASES